MGRRAWSRYRGFPSSTWDKGSQDKGELPSDRKSFPYAQGVERYTDTDPPRRKVPSPLSGSSTNTTLGGRRRLGRSCRVGRSVFVSLRRHGRPGVPETTCPTRWPERSPTDMSGDDYRKPIKIILGRYTLGHVDGKLHTIKHKETLCLGFITCTYLSPIYLLSISLHLLSTTY